MTERLVLVHGFAQTGRCWGPLSEQLTSAGFTVETPDLPGHGLHGGPAASLEATAAGLAERFGPAIFLGYSFGGRICLRLAADHPDALRRLILVGATAGLDDPAERAARIASDERLADRIEMEGVERFLDDWLALPLFAGVPERYRYREERLVNGAAGLAGSLRLAGTGAQEPIWDRLRDLTMPVLATAGQLDTKFVGISQRLVAAIGPNAQLALIPNAGHTAHLEQPDAFLDTITTWLAGRVESS